MARLQARGMNDQLSQSIFTLEADGRPVLAFSCRKYSEAEMIGSDERLRAKLCSVKSGAVPLCEDHSSLRIRLARKDERSLFAEAVSRSESLKIVYLVDLDEAEPNP